MFQFFLLECIIVCIINSLWKRILRGTPLNLNLFMKLRSDITKYEGSNGIYKYSLSKLFDTYFAFHFNNYITRL